jgi:hypothetical protein
MDGEEDIEEEADVQGSEVAKEFMGPNSPRRAGSRSDVWGHTKRLINDHPALKLGFTHVCVMTTSDGVKCFKRLKLSRNAAREGAWNTTVAVAHAHKVRLRFYVIYY